MSISILNDSSSRVFITSFVSFFNSVRLLTLEEEFIKVGLQIDNIRLAKDGEEDGDNELKGGVLEYVENRKKLENFDNQIKELNRIISLIESRNIAQRGVENTDKNLDRKSVV